MGVERDFLGSSSVSLGIFRCFSIKEMYFLCSTSLGNSQTHAQHSIGAELRLVRSAIKLIEEFVDSILILNVEVPLDHCGPKGLVDVLDGLEDTFAAPLRLVAVTKLMCFVLAYQMDQLALCGGSGQVVPVEAPEGTIARCSPVSVTTSTSTVGLPRES